MATWNIDTAHSEVQFKVKHLMVSTVTGAFHSFSGTVQADAEDFSDAQISFSLDVDSIHTNNADRDGHLKGADFFDAANHPHITFSSTALRHVAGDEYALDGHLTMRGTTKPVSLKATYHGRSAGFDGVPVAGFELEGRLHRKEFGLTWDATTEAGGVVVSDEVRIHINIELKLQA